MLRIAAGLLLCALGSLADAHISSNGFLNLHVSGQHIDGSMELAVRDAELAVGIDADHDEQITWGEVRAASPRLQTYVQQHLKIHAAAAGRH